MSLLEATMTRIGPFSRAIFSGFKVAAYAALLSSTAFVASAAADGTFQRVSTLEVPGNPLASFDISWVDPVRELYILADRSNNALDVFSTDDNSFLFQVKGFVGVVSGSNVSGPNGVVTAEKRTAWAGDGDSTVKVVDLRTQKVVDTISTGGKKRADELSFDPRNHMILVANDADDPPFVTIISTKPGHEILKKIEFPDATNGIEQSVWWRRTGLFYQAVPEINGNVGHGEIAVIDPKTLSVVDTLPVDCEPAGLAIGPDAQALVGCNDSSVRVINLMTGNNLATIDQIGHTDEVWFNPGDGNYYAAASNFPSGPIMGVIDSDTNTFVQALPTHAGSHSVAAEPDQNQVYVPFQPTPTDPQCQKGCIVVFQAQEDQSASAGGQDQGQGQGQGQGQDQQNAQQ
jgi:DNA-binding beta-propeller fold protein YncE